MTKYRENLHQNSLGHSRMNIAGRRGVSKKTVNKVLKGSHVEKHLMTVERH